MERTKSRKQEVRTASVGVVPARWVRGKLLPAIFGFTEDAVEYYRLKGAWMEGKHFKKDPANRLVYNIEEISKWLES
ncbi:excisionase family protein [uncultured Microbulbifer sp.]|uniref:excisionase family protein n=1 Tax=uncultured Microbulbifer sp. TaxID=348147 RepID=UPI00345C9C08